MKSIKSSPKVKKSIFDFHFNIPKISTGNDLKHVANVSGRGRGAEISVTANSY